MKKITAGFLIFTCLFFSANFYLRLFQATYGGIPDTSYSKDGQTGPAQPQGSFETRFIKKVKHFKRYFYVGNRHFIPNVEQVVYAFSCMGLFVCFTVQLSTVHSFSVYLRSPPGKPRS